MSKKLYKSDAFEAVHQSAYALLRTDVIGQSTMRDFDIACLTIPRNFAPKDIRALRGANKISQPIFARYLNTSESTIEKWETGAKKPSGMALKLLAIVDKHGLEVLA